MANYYLVERTLIQKQTVKVKAETPYEAFMKAGLDEDCEVRHEHKADWEPNYKSVVKMPYVAGRGY